MENKTTVRTRTIRGQRPLRTLKSLRAVGTEAAEDIDNTIDTEIENE